MSYNWQQSDWPNFRFELGGMEEPLLSFSNHAGQVGGLLEGLPDELGTEAVLDLMITEAVRTSAIEGENLRRSDVMSSIRNRLGLNPVPEPVDSRLADGAGELMVAVRNTYYDALKAAQRGNEVTEWLRWFVGVVVQAQQDAEAQVRFVLQKSKFFQRFESELNEHQLKVVRRMFDAGPEGFTGGMSARKYAALTGASKATATRDLQQLASLGALVPVGGGRSTRYELG